MTTSTEKPTAESQSSADELSDLMVRVQALTDEEFDVFAYFLAMEIRLRAMRRMSESIAALNAIKADFIKRLQEAALHFEQSPDLETFWQKIDKQNAADAKEKAQ